ncbi:hypothetical protein E0L93_00815 [Rubrobacter taiwanensis]|jgi:hypothetical protein|uniref:Uncharacterized protein n=1 Tax=Rubrobacter taiwanensis TaxID=185139 RepID=A0A4R1BS07_9ACTN|nr:hypothetical protein [Rubrobacter taiwanensis]TCJ20589.1 hypothetical protein E0L93_00815 [Rubrobacter taiwanensis]
MKSRPPDREGMRRRVDEALRKHERGEELSERELRIVQMTLYRGGSVAANQGLLQRIRRGRA